MGRTLVFVGRLMLEPVQHGRDVIWHRNVDVSFGIIPFDGETAEQSAGPIFGDGVEFAECPE